MIEKGLCFESLEADYFESTGACDAELGAEEINRRGFGRDIKFLAVVSLKDSIAGTETHFERFQSVSIGLEHSTNGGFLSSFRDGIQGLEHLDCRRDT